MGRTTRRIALLLSVLAIGGRFAALAQTTGPATPGPPPLELQGTGKRSPLVELSYLDVEGAVGYGMTDKEIRLRWRRDFSYLADPQYPPVRSGEGWYVSSQAESVGFWPTEVCGFGENRICVAGKTTTGKTRIQLWEFDATASHNAPDSGLPISRTSRAPVW